MTELPINIWQIIFSHLPNVSHLLECQLVCRLWNQASTEPLYSRVCLNSSSQLQSFVKTIQNTPTLAPLIKEVSTSTGSKWDTEDLFENVMTYCPNLVKIGAHQYDVSLWARLMHAAYNNELQHLQYLPMPEYNAIELYYFTAQAYQKTLRELLLSDRISENDRDRSLYLRPFKKMVQTLQDFPNVESLIVHQYTDEGFIHLDSIIESLPKLKKIDATTYPKNANKARTNNTMFKREDITSRPNIKSFKGRWSMLMDKDDSMKYLLHKFPGVNQLEITNNKATRRDIDNLSMGMIVSFLNYMKDIPLHKVDCSFRKSREVSDYLTRFMQDNNLFKRKIEFSYKKVTSDNGNRQYMTFTEQSTTIFFSPRVSQNTVNLPHVEWLEKVISDKQETKVLSISHICRIQPPVNDLQRIDPLHFNSIEQRSIERREEIPEAITQRDRELKKLHNMAHGFWLNDILDRFPSLRELTIIEPSYINPDTSSIRKHTSLEKLELINLAISKSSTTMADLSLLLPSLKYLHITHLTKPTKRNLELRMVHTNFEKLSWEYTFGDPISDDYKFYLRVVTEAKGRRTFLVGDRYGIEMCSSKEISLAMKSNSKLFMDIRCEGLKNLTLKLNNDINKTFDLSDMIRY